MAKELERRSVLDIPYEEITFADIPLFMYVEEMAHVCGMHINSVRRGIAEERIPADKVAGRWRICRDVVFPNAAAFMATRHDDAREDALSYA